MLILALAVAVTALLAAAGGAAYGGRHTAQQSHRADLAEDNVATLRHRLGERRAVEDMLAGDVSQLRRALAAERGKQARTCGPGPDLHDQITAAADHARRRLGEAGR